MIFIKTILSKTLSQQAYLKLLNTAFLFLYKTGALKNQPAYAYHYFARNLVNKGDTVLDLGANLGYYANLFAGWIGKNGKLYCVEPVLPFQKILKWKLGKKTNVHIFPYALGTEEKDIKLVIPPDQKYFKTGLPHVYQEGEGPALDEHGYVFDAKMKQASKLFKGIAKVDFIKCDIEGYEEYVLPEIKTLLDKHKPIVQVETWGTHKPVVDKLFADLGYHTYQLRNGKLALLKVNDTALGDDYIFIHPKNESAAKKMSRLT